MPTRKISDLVEQCTCSNIDHMPPTHRVFEPGVYEHECPGCRQKVIFVIQRNFASPIAQPRAAIQQVAPRPPWAIE